MLIPLMSAFIQPGAVAPADTVPPSNLAVDRYGSKYVELSWTPATNGTNHNVRSYKIYLNGVWDGQVVRAIYNTTTMNGQNLSLTPNTEYDIYVTAVDEIGNESTATNTITITTPRNQDVGKFKKRRYYY